MMKSSEVRDIAFLVSECLWKQIEYLQYLRAI